MRRTILAACFLLAIWLSVAAAGNPFTSPVIPPMPQSTRRAPASVQLQMRVRVEPLPLLSPLSGSAWLWMQR